MSAGSWGCKMLPNKMLPKDPFILLSFVNTKLRDQYASLEALCAELDADSVELTETLAAIGYQYDQEHNRFL